MLTVLAAAKAFVSKGMSVLPTKADKRPALPSWLEFQTHIPDASALDAMFSGAAGVGVVCGAVSGCLECIDFDEPGAYDEWRKTLEENGYADLAARLVVQTTKNGGHHAVYRCIDGVEGNKPLAYRLTDEGLNARTIKIETRGEGGYFLACPSPGYKMLQGSWSKVPDISAEDRDALFSAARMQNEWVSRPYSHKGPEGISRPGDKFNSEHSWADVLEPAGWLHSHTRGDEDFWVRPGKTKREGVSATTNYKGADIMKCFSSNAYPFEPDATYTKFCAWATIHHGGDMRAAARALSDKEPRQYSKPYAPPSVPQDAPERKPQRWVKASEVKEEEVQWLWERYIPIGEVTMIVGDPGDGKSTVAQAIVTAVTVGSELFGFKFDKGCAVFMSAEQSVNSVTVPRFRQMGADLEQIVLPDETDADDNPVPFVLDKSGIDELRGMCLSVKPRIVVVDTVTAYIEASRDFNSANQTREWMRRLGEIARATPCAMVLIGHLNKNNNAQPLQRVMGSMDFVGASRSVLMVGKDPDDHNVRGLAQIKSNVGPFGEPRGFSLSEGTFAWTDGSRLDCARMMQPAAVKAAQSNREQCEEWVASLFRDTDVVDAPKAEGGKIGGFSTYMVTEVKKKLGVKSERDKFSDDPEGWVWVIDRKEPWWAK